MDDPLHLQNPDEKRWEPATPNEDGPSRCEDELSCQLLLPWKEVTPPCEDVPGPIPSSLEALYHDIVSLEIIII